MSVTTQVIPYGAEDLILEHGRLAKQANASILATIGGTVILVAVVADDKPNTRLDFFPLMVDYRERFYAAGKFPGGFFKREGRPGDLETLKARVIDRSIRPQFPSGFQNETQVYVQVLSTDGENAADMVALTAASTALNISNIPFKTALAAVRVGEIDGELVLNPTYSQMENSTMELLVAGSKAAINMVESGAKELSEARMIEALEFGHKAIIQAIEAQEVMIGQCKKPKMEFEAPSFDAELEAAATSAAQAALPVLATPHMKEERSAKLKEIRNGIWAELEEKFPEQESEFRDIFDKCHKSFARQTVLETERRADGRKCDEVRAIHSEVGVLPRTHGSAVFTRGETQSLGVVTLGTIGDQQKMDNIHGVTYKRFILHYNFPNFCVGETGRIMGPGRREIGHGMLAERALIPAIPDEADFPYTIRVVSEILESNGSSSMASVCSGTLAMMDAGVPIKKPVAGIAMGLIEEDGKVAILSDIQGLEDHLGDMDFKVTGTRDGVTALQMDIKIDGVTSELLAKALEQARQGRMHILDEMAKCLAEPRAELAEHAPRIEVIHIPVDKIKDVIGPGGKVIRGIVEETGAKIDIEDDGTVYVASADGESMKAAIEKIKSMTAEAELEKVYTGKVVRTTDFGAFVQILPNIDGLVHISELEEGRVDTVEDVCRLGDMLTVKVIGIERESGKVRLSRKAVLMGDRYVPRDNERPRRPVGGRGGGGRPPRGDRR